MKMLSNYSLFAAPYDDEMVEEAKNYIRRENLTADEVRIVHRNDQVLVLTKVEMEWPKKV